MIPHAPLATVLHTHKPFLTSTISQLHLSAPQQQRRLRKDQGQPREAERGQEARDQVHGVATADARGRGHGARRRGGHGPRLVLQRQAATGHARRRHHDETRDGADEPCRPRDGLPRRSSSRRGRRRWGSGRGGGHTSNPSRPRAVTLPVPLCENVKSVINVTSLDAQLGPAPVSPLGVVTDRAPGPQTDPVGDRLVLLLLDGQRPLRAERLLRRLRQSAGRWRKGGEGGRSDGRHGGVSQKWKQRRFPTAEKGHTS